MGQIKVFVSPKQVVDRNQFTIDANGNVGIGTTTPGYKVHVIGDIAATSFVNISTRSAKTDISYLDEGAKQDILTQISGMNIAQYRYRAEAASDPLRLGLIAEEAPVQVLAVGGKGVDIYKLSTFTLAGVQEQQKQIDTLKLTVSSTTQAAADSAVTIFDLVGLSKAQGDAITAIQAQMTTLASRVDTLASTTASIQATVADLQAEVAAANAAAAARQVRVRAASSSDASASSTPFIQAVASAVQASMSAIGEWTVSKLSAHVIYADRVEAKTIAVSQGMDIVDQATGNTWCVTIKNGEWSKVPWSCLTPASATAAAAESVQPVVTPIDQASTLNVVPLTQTAPVTGSSGTAGGGATAATTTVEAATSTATTTVSTVATEEPATATTTTPVTTTDVATTTATTTEVVAPITVEVTPAATVTASTTATMTP